MDHFIPWSFTKDDKMWNFVLACPVCNERKSNRLPSIDYLNVIENRNKKIRLIRNDIVQLDFRNYSDDLIRRMWQYAKLSGLKEYNK